MGGRWIFLKTYRASLFNEDLSNEPNFGWDPSRWTVPLRQWEWQMPMYRTAWSSSCLGSLHIFMDFWFYRFRTIFKHAYTFTTSPIPALLTEPDTDYTRSQTTYMRRPELENLEVDNHSHPPLLTIFIVSCQKEFCYLGKCCYLDRFYYLKKPFPIWKTVSSKKNVMRFLINSSLWEILAEFLTDEAETACHGPGKHWI
jgi:hypothetical protein